MGVSKKIIILLVIILLIGAGFFAYKIFYPLLIGKKISVPLPAPTQQQIREQEFGEAIKKAAASDQDLDGISDTEETTKYKTDPMSADTDNDGLTDYQEIFVFKTDPLKADSDGDSFNDGYEVRRGTNPNKV
ncbi:MAG TPA: hypothetical protein VLK22_03840 [Candidatus Udaeobacter sp.]|nr:hypothetical protein [Candidatus Udaeobacter sp.]